MAELDQVLERRDAALKAWRTLSARSKGAEEAVLQRLQELNKLADDVAEEQARAVEEKQRQRVVAAEQALGAAESSVTELQVRLAEERNVLTRLEWETRKARRFDPSAKERLDVIERQERELVEWHGQHSARHPERWPSHLAEQIAKEIERRKDEHAEARARQAAASAENLRAVGLDPAAAKEMLGIGKAWPRRQVS